MHQLSLLKTAKHAERHDYSLVHCQDNGVRPAEVHGAMSFLSDLALLSYG